MDKSNIRRSHWSKWKGDRFNEEGC
jgi:hypothetical protein